jgi:DNA repair photolyase
MHEKEAKSILSAQNGMNIYRGCTHGCIYCDARSACYRMNHDFEDVEVKSNAAELLEYTLKRKRTKCMIATGAMSDPYQPCEEKLGLTRKCLEIVDKYGFGLSIQTKSDLVLRDLDILKSINSRTRCIVQITMTTYDEKLCGILEPDVCTTKRRAEVLNILRDNGIPAIVWLTPVLPFINDTEENLRGILEYCIEAEVYGIVTFGVGLTLREGDREYFYKKLDEHFPGMKQKYMDTYGDAYELPVPEEEERKRYIHETCVNYHIQDDTGKLFTYMHAFVDREAGEQLSLFDLAKL